MVSHLDRERSALLSAVNSIPADARERRPGPDRWSVAEILEHLSMVERRITALITKVVAGARARGLASERDASPVMPSVPVQMLVDRSRTLTASEAVTPTGDLGVVAAMGALEAAREELRAVIVAIDGLALGDVVHPHPVLGPINIYQWIGFIGSHEARHAAQIREIASSEPAAPFRII
jgi:hypothetical protein